MNLTSKKYLSQVEEVIKKAEAGDVYPVYLFIGDRPIIHPQINKLIDCLVFEEARDCMKFFMGDNALIQPNLPGWLGWIHETRWDNIFSVTICKRENEIKHHRA